MNQLCYRFIIKGKVQGVWYRATAKQYADQLGLKGYAKNLADGTVEVIACGEETILLQYEKKLWQGSQLSKVTEVIKSNIEHNSYTEFSTY